MYLSLIYTDLSSSLRINATMLSRLVILRHFGSSKLMDPILRSGHLCSVCTSFILRRLFYVSICSERSAYPHLAHLLPEWAIHSYILLASLLTNRRSRAPRQRFLSQSKTSEVCKPVFRVRERKVKEFDASGECETVFRPDFEASLRGVQPFHCLKYNPRMWVTGPTRHFAAQESACRFLVQELGTSEIGIQDKHGNTTLHYLAGARVPNIALIDWLKVQDTGTSVCDKTRNVWGYTPQDLHQYGETIGSSGGEG